MTTGKAQSASKERALTPEIAGEIEELMKVAPRLAFAEHPQVAQITPRSVWIMRTLIALGVVSIGLFFWYVLVEADIGEAWLFWPLIGFFSFGAVLSLYEWFCYLGVKAEHEPAQARRQWSVDVLTTWCPGEPKDMVVATLKSILRIKYPHTTYLCDEGNDPALREVCARLGVIHVTREEKIGAKAGNINNALRMATGEIVVIMDPDHETAPYFLDRVVGYFEDPEIGFVQHVQAYYNQGESLVARAAAEQTYHFYGPVQKGMHGHGTAQAIGANCAFRRKALDSIGGHATGLAEDMATTLKLYAAGWRSIYTPQILSRGQVPASFAGYCKQQLKWACGVWDILIESYCRAYPAISWRNRLHYLMNGLFYFRGLFVLLGVLVPMVSLFTGLLPMSITLGEFLIWFGPMLAAQLLIRQGAQAWLLEKDEYGLHLAGGFLMNAVWLIHLRGMMAALLRVKIPYIPTPKDDAATNAWSLAAPNLVLVGASLAAMAYGLMWDKSPYALVMALFALINIISLGTISLAAQQKFLAALGSQLKWPCKALALLARPLARLKQGLCWVLRKSAAPLMLLVAGSVAYAHLPEQESAQLERFWSIQEGTLEKEGGGFLLGIYRPSLYDTIYEGVALEDAMADIEDVTGAIGQHASIIGLYHWWGDDAIEHFPRSTLDRIRASGAIPMITWQPTLTRFDWAAEFENTAADRQVMRMIVDGRLDYFIEAYANEIRDYGGPVMIRFAHEMDNPQYPWSPVGGNSPEDYVAAWRYVVEYFEGLGATNAVWVWNPWRSATLDQYYPGSEYVDWIGLTMLNYGSVEGDSSWTDFAALYAPFRDWARWRQKPVLLAEFGSTELGGSREAWLAEALGDIQSYSEIEGLVFFDVVNDASVPIAWESEIADGVIDWEIDPASPQLHFALTQLLAERPAYRPQPAMVLHEQAVSNRVGRSGEGWQLTHNGQPFFIRGVAYNAGQGWRTVSEPTRRTVERDFAAIQRMGANAIRRYHPHWGDANILDAADDHELAVIPGYWLAVDVDYIGDKSELDAIEAEVVAMVEAQVDEPAVLFWMLGNETWGLLKHEYEQPYLTEMRHAYLRFLDRLAQRIRAIDPSRPVGTAFEASAELPGALADLDRLAPHIDVIGINAYYEPHLSRLNHSVQVFGGARPWFLSEFGPDGYWDAYETQWSAQGFPIEPSESEKAFQYTDRYRRFVTELAGSSLGGVAFAWRDRYEGSPTWFGLSDFNGIPKPAYFALQQLWSPARIDNVPQVQSLRARLDTEAARPDQRLRLAISAVDWSEDCALEVAIYDADSYEQITSTDAACADGVLDLAAPVREGRYWVRASAQAGKAMVASISQPLVVTSEAAILIDAP